MALTPLHSSRPLPVTSRLTCKPSLFLTSNHSSTDIYPSSTSKSSSALVGYAAIDGDNTWVDPLANYLSCDISDTNSGANAIDLFGLNN